MSKNVYQNNFPTFQLDCSHAIGSPWTQTNKKMRGLNSETPEQKRVRMADYEFLLVKKGGKLLVVFFDVITLTNDTILRYRKQWHQNLHKGLGHLPENPPVTWDSQTQFANKHLKQGITKNFNTSMGLSSNGVPQG